jgi:activator of HSP90 ATPase
MVTTGTSGTSGTSTHEELKAYFKQRNADLKQLGQDLQSGDLTDAEQEFQDIVSLAQDNPLPTGKQFFANVRQQDFDAIGQALQSGNASDALQSFTQLEDSFHHKVQDSTGSASDLHATSSSADSQSTQAGTASSTGTVSTLRSASSDTTLGSLLSISA